MNLSSSGKMDPPEPTIESVSAALEALGPLLEDTEGVGIVGSLARGDLRPRSDIDILVVEKEDAGHDSSFWHSTIGKCLRRFDRDVSVLVFTIPVLKKVPDWNTLGLAADAIMVHDEGKVAPVLKRIVDKAHSVGLRRDYSDRWPVFKMNRPLKFGEIIKVELENDE